MNISRKAYLSGVSDEEWSLVVLYLLLMTGAAPQHQHDLRELFNGLRYVMRYGIAWRATPSLCKFLVGNSASGVILSEGRGAVRWTWWRRFCLEMINSRRFAGATRGWVTIVLRRGRKNGLLPIR